MIDLCCGLKGASAAMRERGWEVVTVDNDPRFEPTVIADVRTWQWTGRRPDLVWSSPPCTEFSRESMPWTRRGIVPDLAIVEACVRIAREANARYWLLENTRGALRWLKSLLGEPKYRMHPQFLWGCPPVGFQPSWVKLPKKRHSSPELRAIVPWHISLALARAVELDGADRRVRRQIAGGDRSGQVEVDTARSARAPAGEARTETSSAAQSRSVHDDQAQCGPPTAAAAEVRARKSKGGAS